MSVSKAGGIVQDIIDSGVTAGPQRRPSVLLAFPSAEAFGTAVVSGGTIHELSGISRGTSGTAGSLDVTDHRAPRAGSSAKSRQSTPKSPLTRS